MLVTTLKGQATDIISYLTFKKFLTIMSSVSGRPPPLSRETISRITCKYFNFTKVHGDSIKSFPSYSDRNYYFQGKCMNAASLEFVLKLNNPLYTTFEEMKGICSVMEHLTSHGFSTQHPLTSREGSHIIKLTYAELSGTLEDNKGIETRDSTTDTCGANKREPGFKYFVSVLSYIPGQLFDKVEKRYLTPKLLYEIGELLGRIDQELMASIIYCSDCDRLLRCIPLLDSVGPPDNGPSLLSFVIILLEVILYKMWLAIYKGSYTFVLCKEVCPLSECIYSL